MSYNWCNECRLDILSVTSEENKLIYSVGLEEAEVYLKDEDIERVIYRYNGEKSTIANKDAYHLVVGDGNAQRDVYHYLKPGGPAPQLRLGITKHRGIGTWSSLPHAFELNIEPGFEEAFFYLISGATKRAIQVGDGMWCDGTKVKETWFVEDHSFGTVPMGYHPIVGEPGVMVHYIWAYVCKEKRWEKI